MALKLATVDIPAVGKREVIVRNEIIGLNPVDWKVLRGLPPWSKGHVPGVDGAGIVTDLGNDSLKPWLERRVAYPQSLHKQGSFARYTPVDARAVMECPTVSARLSPLED